METIRELYLKNDRILPFAVRSKAWATNTYVIILKFGVRDEVDKKLETDYSLHPVGIPITNGEPNNMFENDVLFAKYRFIPKFNEPNWDRVEHIDLTVFEKKEINGLNNFIQFGKYIGWMIKDVINSDLNYVKWALRNINEFTLADDAINYIESRGLNFDTTLIKLAKQKQKDIGNFDSRLQDKKEELTHLSLSDDDDFIEQSVIIQSKNWDNTENNFESEKSIEVNKRVIDEKYIEELHAEFAKTRANLGSNDKLKWTDKDIEQLKGLCRLKATNEHISNVMRRSIYNIEARIIELNLDKIL